ncbi:MAG TPA: hypothetical protein PLG13_05730 [Prolixibacteraceae bacterium]|nr:hypothetical protein [Prolixibacteraceae bacterium]
MPFILENFPSLQTILVGVPLFLAWTWCCLLVAGRLKRRGMRTGYTRKIFHFLIFGTVVLLQWLWGTPSVLVFGAMCSLVVFYAVFRGPGDLLYEALAREADAPRRSWFVILPWLTTLVGGLLSNVLFGNLAIAGYLVTGMGDAIGEPVGVRFGRHPYKAWSLTGVRATRSLEGSLAVFLFSALALVISVLIFPVLGEVSHWFLRVVAIALIAALLEAFTPHGWDNATMQLIPTALVYWWMT